jgi:CarD family transcriptional regulator
MAKAKPAKKKQAAKPVAKKKGPVRAAKAPVAKTSASKSPAAKAKSVKTAPAKAVKPGAKSAAPKTHAAAQHKTNTAAHKPAVVHKPAAHKPVAAKPAAPMAKPMPKPVALAFKAPVAPLKPQAAAPVTVPKKPSFKVGELVVYPAHGVGKISNVEEQEIAGIKLELYIVDFEKEKLRLKVPTNRAEQKGMRHLADRVMIEAAMKVIRGRARIKRTMWSRRAQEYDAKINSGDMLSVAEVIRDLYRSERQPEQSYSERQLFEQALARFARELAAVRKVDEDQCIKELEDYLARNAKRGAAAGDKTEDEAADEAA